MNNGINLVVKRIDPKVEELQKRIKLLRLIAMVVLSLVTLVSGVLFILIATSSLPSLRQEEQQLFASLNESNSSIQRSVLIDKQLDHVQTVLSSRSDLPEVLQQVLSNTPASLNVVSYTANSGQLELTIQATTLADIEIFLDQVRVLSEQEKIYKNVSLETLSISQAQGVYQFRVIMTN